MHLYDEANGNFRQIYEEAVALCHIGLRLVMQVLPWRQELC